MEYGKYTARIGEKLTRTPIVPDAGIEVFYAHGSKGSRRAMPYLGRRPSNASLLSHADIVVVSTRGRSRRVLVVCEIEEEGAEPKRIIGDVCNTLLARKLRAGGVDFTLHSCSIVLGIKIREKGMSKVKATKLVVAMRKIQIGGSPHRKKIVLICASDPEVLMRRVEKKIRRIVEECVS